MPLSLTDLAMLGLTVLLAGLFGASRLRVRRVERARSGATQIYRVQVYGRPARHEESVGKILAMPDLIELRT
jgi:hypothetical protein